jgi:hypothetical protein
MARAARSWPLVALAAVLAVALGAVTTVPMRAPLVAAGLILLAVTAIMRSAERRAARSDTETTTVGLEDR